MFDILIGIKSRFLNAYNDSDFLLQKKANALFIFNFTIIIIIALLLSVMIFAAPEKVGIVAPVITTIITGLSISLILLKYGKYAAAASATTLFIVILLIAALYGRAFRFPDTVYSTNLYFILAMIVVGTLFNSRRFVLILTAFIIINDIALFYIIKQKLTGDALATATNGAIYSICALLIITVISQILYGIFNSSIEKINKEVETNKKQYELYRMFLHQLRIHLQNFHGFPARWLQPRMFSLPIPRARLLQLKKLLQQ
jgi:hypothetical protein